MDHNWIIFFVGLFSCISSKYTNRPLSKSPTDYRGLYSFPCDQLDRVYAGYPVVNEFGFRGIRSSQDPTIITVTVNGTVVRVYELVDVSGQFNVLRSKVHGVDGQNQYRCSKYFTLDRLSNLLVAYESDWEVFDNRPTICEICRGQPLQALVLQDVDVKIAPWQELGCNIPIVCPALNKNQRRCTCSSQQRGQTGGFCCKKTKNRPRTRKN